MFEITFEECKFFLWPDEIVPVGGVDQSPGEDREAEHQPGHDGEHHRHQQVDEEGYEGPEGE